VIGYIVRASFPANPQAFIFWRGSEQEAVFADDFRASGIEAWLLQHCEDWAIEVDDLEFDLEALEDARWIVDVLFASVEDAVLFELRWG